MSVVFEDSDLTGKTKSFLLKEFDKKVSKNGDSMTGDLDMQTNFIHSTAIPNNNSDLVNKKYVDDSDATKLSLNGGSMSGDVNMQNHKLVNLKDPVDSKDSTHKKYVDDADNLKLSLTGGTMIGDIRINTYRIWSTLNPTSDKHLARKNMWMTQIIENRCDKNYKNQRSKKSGIGKKTCKNFKRSKSKKSKTTF